MLSSGMSVRRGLLVVLEGCDRCGKSTQCKRLVERLNASEHPAELWRFPERSTQIGGVINQYLRKEVELDDKAAHLLFSANRWELHPAMQEKLASGITLVVDRYAFSGVAFTSAKEGMDMDWCKSPDAGLLAPDVLIHLQLAAKEAESRGGFGEERYEVASFQEKVRSKFAELYASLENVQPEVMDVTGLSIDEVGGKIESLVLPQLQGKKAPGTPKTLW